MDSRGAHRPSHTHGHGSILHSGHKGAAARVSVNRHMESQRVPPGRIPQPRGEGHSDPSSHVGGPGRPEYKERSRGRKPAFQDVSPHELVLARWPEGRRVAEAVSKAGDTLTRAGAQSVLRKGRGQRGPRPSGSGVAPQTAVSSRGARGTKAVSPEGAGTQGPHVCRRLWAEGSLCPGSFGGPGRCGEAEVGPVDLLPGGGGGCRPPEAECRAR